MSTIAQKLPNRLPLKFKDESFGAIEMLQNFSAKISPEMNRKMNGIVILDQELILGTRNA